MAFCTSCGNQVAGNDVYCAKCGKRQGTAAAGAGGGPELLANMTPRTASMLCYIPVFGWLAAIIVLATPRFQHDREVRFHAFQGLYLFVVWLIVDWVVSPFMVVSSGTGIHELRLLKGLLQLAVFGAWIFMIVKTSHNESYHLPLVGELAERSVAEQR